MPSQSFNHYEAEVAEGLESIAEQEIRAIPNLTNILTLKSGVQFHYNHDFKHLLTLKTVNSVYLVLSYDVPRPKALLGHQHFHRLLEAIKFVRRQPDSTFESLYFSMAGADSSVMKRLKSEISQHTNLKLRDEGDLLIRIRRTKSGWDVLIRLTPRPLATRDWRVCNLEGALNAPTARAMAILAPLKSIDHYLNIACGSGTLLIETVAQYNLQYAIGVDNDLHALNCAEANVRHANIASLTTLLHGDARNLSIPSNSIDVIHADLPFGQLVGSHQDNLQLYPAILGEAHRVLKPQGRFILITHEIRLMDMLLEKAGLWHNERTLKISLRGLHPRIYVLRKQT